MAVALCLAGPAADAGAANHRVAISDYRWSTPEIQINAGEHVTWYWTGPDLMHSVTGQSANAKSLDSDPGINQPEHRLGDTFQLSFTQPGVYQFQCKLHGSVRGEIFVSPAPGDPVAEADPVPRTHVDLRPPTISALRLQRRSVHRGSALALRYSLDERAAVAVDLFRYRHGRRVFAGYQAWRGHIGFNTVGLGTIGAHFHARPGRYLAVIRATDESANESGPKRLALRILPRRR